MSARLFPASRIVRLCDFRKIVKRSERDVLRCRPVRKRLVWFVCKFAVLTYGCLRRCEEGQYSKIAKDSMSPERT